MSRTPEASRWLDAVAADFSHSDRAPVLGSPADVGLVVEDVTFPSEDGLTLRGWFVPAEDATAVVVVSHPRWFSRSGLPSDRQPWAAALAPTGNDVAVSFLPDLRLLHDAGYHVLAYDQRGCGLSDSDDGGLTSGGRRESRDLVGALRHVRSRPGLGRLPVAVFGRCLGANAALFALARVPQELAAVRCLVACQPLSPRMVLEGRLARAGLPSSMVAALDDRIRLLTGWSLQEMSPVGAAAHARLPVLLYQVRGDVMTRPEDVQAIHDAIPSEDKELCWIEGTTRRWDGYLHFQRQPDHVLAWLHRRLALTTSPAG